MKDNDVDVEMNSYEEAFDLLGMDLPEHLRGSVPSLANVADFLVEHDALGMDEDTFDKIIKEE